MYFALLFLSHKILTMVDTGILRHIWDEPHVEEVELLKVGWGSRRAKKEVGTKCDMRKTVDWESETKVRIEREGKGA